MGISNGSAEIEVILDCSLIHSIHILRGRPAFNTITCEVAIFSLDGSQNKRLLKFYLCDRHMFEVEEFCRKQVT